MTAQTSPLQSAAGQIRFFMPLTKVVKNDDGSRTVSGYASTPTLDSDNEIVTLDAIKGALPGYMEWANIRQMHGPNAIGVAKEANVDSNGLFLTAKVVASEAIRLIDEEVLKGFSIGGAIKKKVGKEIRELELIEISLVDRPANEDCRFQVMKGHKVVTEEGVELIEAALPATIDDAGNLVLKSSDRSALRGLLEWLGLAKGGNASGDGEKPYGDVEYADAGSQSDGKHRYPIDTENHIRAAWNYIHKPKNREPYTAAQLERIEGKIVAAWKDKIDADGPPEASSKSAAASTEPLEKSIRALGDLIYAFGSIRDAQRSLMREEMIEGDGDDKAMADELGRIAEQLARVISDKASHEGTEALMMDDADDILFQQYYPEYGAVIMAGANISADEKALLAAIRKRKGSMSKAEHMSKAKEHMGECMKCHKDAMEACAKLHKMHGDHMHSMKTHKAAADGSDEPEFNHAKAVGHLAEVATSLGEAHDHAELSEHHMSESAGQSETPAQDEPGGNAGGVPGAGRTIAAPNGPGYDPVEPYPGKASFTRDEVLAIVKGERATAEADELRKQLQSLGRKAGPRAPVEAFSFDKSAPVAAAAGREDDTSILYKDVDPRAYDRKDDGTLVDKHAATNAGAALLGNILRNPQRFGKGVNDPGARSPMLGRNG